MSISKEKVLLQRFFNIIIEIIDEFEHASIIFNKDFVIFKKREIEELLQESETICSEEFKVFFRRHYSCVYEVLQTIEDKREKRVSGKNTELRYLQVKLGICKSYIEQKLKNYSH